MPTSTAPPAPGPPAAAWVARGLRLGLGLGLVLGVAGQTILHLHDGKVGLALLPAAVALTAMSFGLAGLLIALATAPARGSSWGPWLAAGGLGAFTFVHLISLWVRVWTGVFPTTAPVGMLLASPGQFLRAGLLGQGRRLALLLVVTAALGLLFARLLPRRLPECGWKKPLAAGLGMAATLGLVALSPAISGPVQVLQMATPEMRWLSTLVARRSALEREVTLVPVPRGEPLTAARDWEARAASAPGERPGMPRPNVLLLMLESVSADHLHYGGYPRPVSPHLDRLAAEGWSFTRAWTTATQSNYAQTAILSSLLPMRHRELETYVRLDYPRFLFHDLFHALGYETATISSQNEEWQGMRRFETTETPTHFFHSLDHPGPHLGRGAERKLPDHLTVDHLVSWLEGQQRTSGGDRPWAAYVNFQRTHFPYEPPPGYRGPFQPSDPEAASFSFLHYPKSEIPAAVNRYDNALLYVDSQVGRVVEYLERTGQAERTLVAVVGDHGELFGESGHFTHGTTLDEREVRAPLLLYWPGTLAPRRIDTPVSTLDLLPTLADLVGAPPHPSFQGRSFRDQETYAATRPALFLTLQSVGSNYGVVCWPWKLTANWTSSEVQLVKVDVDYEEREETSTAARAAARSLLTLVASQRHAQLDYHLGPAERRRQEFAPRRLSCPEDLPGYEPLGVPRRMPPTEGKQRS